MRRRSTGRTIVALITLALLAGGAGAAWLLAEWARPYRGFPSEGVFVEIPRGMSSGAIARKLAENGVVHSRIAFEILCRARGRSLQAGEYFFDRPVTPTEVFRKIAEGRVYVKVVTVPEGKTMKEIAALMEQEGLSSREAFLTAARDASLIVDLSPQARNLEGFLFPSTYQFSRHVAPGQIVDAMVKQFRAVWDRLQKESSTPDSRSAEEIVTLASLVEKETGVKEERPLVAAVFENRLQRGMALQCDPTVIYALDSRGEYTGSLSGKDLQVKSPYNTYRNPGLPPGPIANPGEASLRAALHPAEENYLYFVSNAQGGHVFSQTLEEHNRNVTQYRRMLAQNGAAANAQDTQNDPAKAEIREAPKGKPPAESAVRKAPTRKAPAKKVRTAPKKRP